MPLQSIPLSRIRFSNTLLFDQDVEVAIAAFGLQSKIFSTFLTENPIVPMEKEKKRPRGLAAQRAAKKAKVSEEPEANTKDAQTVVLDKIVEEGDEIGEAAALYESAIEKAGARVVDVEKIMEKWELKEYYRVGSGFCTSTYSRHGA